MEHTLLPFVTEFFTKLGIQLDHLSIHQIKEDINIEIKTPDSALLIGMHGKNIEVFQHLLSRMIERQLHQFVHVHLEVNDYVKQKEEKLFRFLDSKISLIMSHGKPVHIPSLSSYDRKKAHNYIAEKEIIGIKTHSEGEGETRTLVITYLGELIKATNTHTIGNTTHSLSDDGVGI